MPPINLLRSAIVLAAVSLLAGCELVVLNPAGDIAAQQGRLIVIATALMLLIVVPVIIATLVFAWKYRQGSKAAETEYDPEWHHSTKLELLIWTAPLLIIIALGSLTWISTHQLDPYRPLDRISAEKPLSPDVKPLEVEVVSLDWKWLFFYPEQGIATVNELAAPVDRPIRFKLTAANTMSAFYVPDLAGMIYTMPGMETQLNAVINKPGVYSGKSSHYSGGGFSGMTFKFHGLSDADFDAWVNKAKTDGNVLDREAYKALVVPSKRHPVERFSSVENQLYQRILNRCVEEGQACMHDIMAKDAAKAAAGKRGVAAPAETPAAPSASTNEAAAPAAEVAAPVASAASDVADNGAAPSTSSAGGQQ